MQNEVQVGRSVLLSRLVAIGIITGSTSLALQKNGAGFYLLEGEACRAVWAGKRLDRLY